MSKKHSIDNSRREFLKKSIMSACAFFVSTSPLKILANDNKSDTLIKSLTNEEAYIIAKKAKELFYKKEYIDASSLYRQLIDSFPNEIQYYIDYGKVHTAQNLFLEKAELFRIGLQRNPENPFFMHRLSLSVRSICKGQNKAANNFAIKYGINDLYDYSAQLLIDAIHINPENKGFYFDLRDFHIDNDTESLVRLSDEIDEKVVMLTTPYEEKWKKTRLSRKPNMSPEIDKAIARIRSTHRRELYNTKEKNNRNRAISQVEKRYWMSGSLNAIKKKDFDSINTYAMRILNDNINETNTIGLIRKSYKKEKQYNRLISFNRSLYKNNPSINNILSLCSSIIKYGGNSGLGVINYLNQIPDPDLLESVHACMYYSCYASAYINNGKVLLARKKIIEGIEQIGVGGLSYNLLELYANSYISTNPKVGINILKKLSGKNASEKGDDDIWKHVDNYINYSQVKNLHIDEQLKPLYALAKIQQKSDKSGYNITLQEIDNLRTLKKEI